jgi:hypothetical protein
MRNVIRFFLLAAGLCLLSGACNRTSEHSGQPGNIITERIEYPVFIKDPYDIDDGEWWIENIETSKRMAFVQTLFDRAYAGKVKAYHADSRKQLTVEEVKRIGNESDTLTLQRPEPPYDHYDTIVHRAFSLNQIHKVKFLEEWSFDKDSYTMTKHVLGVAPMMAVYAGDSELLGYRSLFWILFDDRFAAK